MLSVYPPWRFNVPSRHDTWGKSLPQKYRSSSFHSLFPLLFSRWEEDPVVLLWCSPIQPLLTGIWWTGPVLSLESFLSTWEAACVYKKVCVFTPACVRVCFIVMPRTSELVPCQVVPSQLAVAHAFVLCNALYSTHDTHCCEEPFTRSPSLPPLVCVCVFYGSDLDVRRKLETRVGQ